MYGGQERPVQSFGGETWGKESTLKTQDNIKLGVQDLAQDRDRWRVLITRY